MTATTHHCEAVVHLRDILLAIIGTVKSKDLKRTVSERPINNIDLTDDKTSCYTTATSNEPARRNRIEQHHASPGAAQLRRRHVDY
jgi:hypothetical protein